MANLYVYLLPAILHAVFACVPLAPPQPRPTPKPPGATGEVPATTTTTETATTTMEACSGTPDNSTVTEDGNRCVFPFKDGDILHMSCVDYKGKYDWCATSLKSDCSFDTWSKCLETTSKPEEKCLTEEVNSGKECLFPFIFEGKESMECLPYKGKYWCGLTYEYDKQRWGYCTQALCPPTKVEATEVPVTTQGPTEVPATSQEPETTTEGSNGTETNPTTESTPTAEITIEEQEKATTTFQVSHKEQKYSCSFKFSYSLGEGIQVLTPLSSSCSKSSANAKSISFLEKHEFKVFTSEGIELTCSLFAIFEETEDGINLVETVVKQSLQCLPDPEMCLTEGGPDFPAKCSVPFIYMNRIYQDCTDMKGEKLVNDKLWCATQTRSDQTMVDGKWAWCNNACGYCGGRDLEPPTKGNSSSTTNQPTTVNPKICITEGSPDPDKACVFPFNYNGQDYNECKSYNGRFWCGLQYEYNKDNWGYCKETVCPPTAASGTSRWGTRSRSKCGFDCILRPNKKMKSFTTGVSDENLTPPSLIETNDLTDLNWNVLPKGNFQFLKGQKGVHLICPETQFSKFKSQRSIQVTCSGDSIFNVTTPYSLKFWSGEKNTNFGCDPCPFSYEFVNGDEDQNLNTLSLKLRIENITECINHCDLSPSCTAFQYSSMELICSLLEKVTTSTASISKATICKKKEPPTSCSNGSTRMCQIERTNLVDFDNHEAGPFRTVRVNPAGLTVTAGAIIAIPSLPPHADRTHYKSTYSSSLNIPIRAVIKLIGKEVFDSNGKLKRMIRSLAAYDIDFRAAALPVQWLNDDNNARALIPIAGGTKFDYSNPRKYTGDHYGYTMGHLIPARFFKTLFAKDRTEVVLDLQSYTTNIFPQNKESNNANGANSENWYRYEHLEYAAAKNCLRGPTNTNFEFHVAHGTIPSGPLNDGMAYWDQIQTMTKKTDFRMVNFNHLNNRASEPNTMVNIPRYFYMAFCCSNGKPKFVSDGTDAAPVKGTILDQAKYVIFEHSITEENGRKVNVAMGDKATNYKTAKEMLTALEKLWISEHPLRSALDQPILFTETNVGKCHGFDNPPVPVLG